MLRAGAPASVLLTDYTMPGMDGLALIEAARNVRPGLPAVLLTGNAVLSAAQAEDDIRRLRKPVRAKELAACIAGLVEAAEPRPERQAAAQFEPGVSSPPHPP